jgi:class 3 adenylate cyclase
MRQLAAIMFSDMTGYTALMQQNELPNWRES